jgi:3-oxoadipate enol-lactonase
MKVRANGIEISYAVEGSGPWLVFSHSLACDLSMWNEQAAAFASRYRVLRYDTRGHGKSGAPNSDYTLDQLATDAKSLLDALEIKSCHWVGLSMGGMIGQTFALKYPGIFRTLTLADTSSRRHENARQMWDERIKLANEQGMAGLVDGTLARWFTEPFRRSNQEMMARVAAMIRTTPVAGYAGCARAISVLDLTHRLKEIKCPALVMAGEQDAGTPPAMAREIHDNLPGSELLIIPSASHLSNLEQPAVFNRALQAFLDKHPE